ncbi:MAG: hypothetical protein UV60_C0015G0016 [Parcubacteria group bacterium GW2011_GWA2_43_11]|nr:MAG: hypothetical protein UU89_C0044G0002 [Parcubacteria group bacterium GW2011_GWC2_42_11]KKS84748.1 MAG: hypothetical protein UV60_C0015G0016 [Parcubacteria group bacterium GW2011_GWA2_43_11]
MQQPTLAEIEGVFFDAMLAGWASGAPAKNIPELPGSRIISFCSGDFEVKDIFFVTPHSSKSGGTTTISFQGDPVWLMQYGGWYLEHAVSFLKSCLNHAYKERHFYGGRGLSRVRGTNMTYLNNIACNYFEAFGGNEWIIDSNGGYLGTHWYRGMLLLS